MKEIDYQVGQALSHIATTAPRYGNMNWTRVQDFLLANKLVVKLTDKNLGLVVFPIEWYIHESMKMLGDLTIYWMVSSMDMGGLLGKLFNKLPK